MSRKTNPGFSGAQRKSPFKTRFGLGTVALIPSSWGNSRDSGTSEMNSSDHEGLSLPASSDSSSARIPTGLPVSPQAQSDASLQLRSGSFQRKSGSPRKLTVCFREPSPWKTAREPAICFISMN